LHQAFAVAQIDKDDAAVVAPTMDPAAQADSLAEQRFSSSGFAWTCSVSVFNDSVIQVICRDRLTSAGVSW
jgi:hypothetical protein